MYSNTIDHFVHDETQTVINPGKLHSLCIIALERHYQSGIINSIHIRDHMY